MAKQFYVWLLQASILLGCETEELRFSEQETNLACLNQDVLVQVSSDTLQQTTAIGHGHVHGFISNKCESHTI